MFFMMILALLNIKINLYNVYLIEIFGKTFSLKSFLYFKTYNY